MAASGAFWNRKGDVRTPTALVEAKWTAKSQVTIKSSVLDKIEEEAILDGRMPVLGLCVAGKNWVMMTENDFLEREEAFAEIADSRTVREESTVSKLA